MRRRRSPSQGLTDVSNFDAASGKWKGMHMDVAWVRVYQSDTQGESRGLNPPITYETRRKLLANRVTCNLLPELRCMLKLDGGKEGAAKARAHPLPSSPLPSLSRRCVPLSLLPPLRLPPTSPRL